MNHLGRRESKHTIHFRDDLSEYSSPSAWGDCNPLSLGDHRLTAFGLQARRTVGEAVLRAQWERQCEADAEACRCFGSPAARRCLEVIRRTPPQPAIVFQWSEVQSLILIPHEGERCPYLIAVDSQDGSREWLLQAGSQRGRARWAVEMTAAVLRERQAAQVGGGCTCSGNHSGRLSTSLFMDMVRVACEVARLQPSPECIERLIEALDLLMESRQMGPCRGAESGVHQPGALCFPLAPLRRFAGAARRTHADFVEWRRWREVVRLVQAPCGCDAALWSERVLPFLGPQDSSMRDPLFKGYPPAVDSQLAAAAERCRRTLS